ncbi:hypothetical protein [Flavobacterium sp.]|jgi:hypothetical protein|uniref:hypothetical protein n=1 Tax=Flavobacterium sp. TaxID=239 RepID=UPI0037C14821
MSLADKVIFTQFILLLICLVWLVVETVFRQPCVNKQQDKEAVDGSVFSSVKITTDKPTTLAGYGLVDAALTTETEDLTPTKPFTIKQLPELKGENFVKFCDYCGQRVS